MENDMETDDTYGMIIGCKRKILHDLECIVYTKLQYYSIVMS